MLKQLSLYSTAIIEKFTGMYFLNIDRESLSQNNWLFLSVHNYTEFFILEQRYDSMITSIVENCPNCGKENQYAMGSCRNCGTERNQSTAY
jgi:hypothetical protein